MLNVAVAGPVPQDSREIDLDMEYPLAELPFDDYSQEPISTTNNMISMDKNECTSDAVIRDENVDTQNGIFGREVGLCRERGNYPEKLIHPSILGPGLDGSTTSHNPCEDPDHKEYVTCGGQEVRSIQVQEITYVFNCVRGKYCSYQHLASD